MRKLVLSIMCIVFGMILVSQQAYAHVLQTSGTIGGVLHVDPEDDPIIGQVATFVFDVKDTAKKFSTEKCNCKVIILEDGKEILNQSATANNSSLSFSYVFIHKNVYTVKLVGESIDNSFQKFSLSYDIRVEREKDNSKDISSFVTPMNMLIAVGIIVIALLSIVVYKRKQ